MITGSVIDTGGTLLPAKVATGGKFSAGVAETGGKFPAGVTTIDADIGKDVSVDGKFAAGNNDTTDAP